MQNQSLHENKESHINPWFAEVIWFVEIMIIIKVFHDFPKTKEIIPNFPSPENIFSNSKTFTGFSRQHNPERRRRKRLHITILRGPFFSLHGLYTDRPRPSLWLDASELTLSSPDATLKTSSTTEPTARRAALDEWTSFQMVSLSTCRHTEVYIAF